MGLPTLRRIHIRRDKRCLCHALYCCLLTSCEASLLHTSREPSGGSSLCSASLLDIMADAAARQLKIKLGVCKRMVNEVAGYEKEAKDNEAKVKKMRDDGKDPYDIRKQEEVLQESYMMIPDSKARMTRAMEDLECFLSQHSDTEGIPEDQLEQARGLLAEAGVA